MGSGQPPLGYSYAVANGEYVVNLYFANTFGGTALPGSRVFDIVIENVVQHASFDQVVAAGGSGVVVIRSALVLVPAILVWEFLHYRRRRLHGRL